MTERTFGWIQEAYKLDSLKDCVSVFVRHSRMNELLISDKIPRLVSVSMGRDEFLQELSEAEIVIPYAHLKGKGPQGGKREDAPCSGIFQAALKGQRREYQGDWPADSYARWAVSVGFLDYDEKDDTCRLTALGRGFVMAEEGSDEETEILTQALGASPPVVRVMELLADRGHLTKFEIGKELGFKTEAGFTSVPQKYILQMIKGNPAQMNRILSDTEGTSDKYVRTICSWLKTLGWVTQYGKKITEKIGAQILEGVILQSYELTADGLKALRKINGASRYAKVSRRVPWQMLSTKPADKNYIRNRRTYLIQYISHSYHSIAEIKRFLLTKRIDEPEEVIEEDLKGLVSMGIHINQSIHGYRIMDEIVGLAIPTIAVTASAADTTLIKNELRKKLLHVDHAYLVLVDLSWDGKSNRDFEIETAELFTSELGFDGARLGDTRKPDVCIYKGENGLIIDNKAYSRGYSLPMAQADEMIRYIDENIHRDKKRNPNEWWNIFPAAVKKYGFAFVSSNFKGGFQDRLDVIHTRTGYDGSCCSAVNLLLLGEKLKSGRMSVDAFFQTMKSNSEIEEA